jgi:hypothetical protein
LKLLENPPWGDSDDDKNLEEDYLQRKKIHSYLYKETMYSIVQVYLRRKVENSIHNAVDKKPNTQMSLVILKHNPENDPDTDMPEKI